MKWATADRPGGNSRAGSDTGSRAHTRQSPAKRWLWSICLLPVLLLALVVSTFTTSPLAAQESATLKGMLINGTAGSPLPSGVAVSLHALGETGGLAYSAETTTVAGGGFDFRELPVTGVSRYAVVAEYQGARYGAALPPGGLGQPLELVVYEATQDLSVVQIEQQALIIADIRGRGRALAAVGLINLTNRSDLTLVPDLTNLAGTGQFSFLRFSLPPGAEDLDVQTDLTGGQVIPMGTGFAMVAPIPPGEHTISYSLNFPYEGQSVTFRDGLIQGATVYQVLAPQRLGQLQVSPLAQMPPANIGGAQYSVWEGRDFAPGQDLNLTLSGLPQPGWLGRVTYRATEASFWHLAIPVALGLVLAFALLYGVFRAPRTALSTAEAAEGAASGSRSDLLLSVAALDEQHQQGQVTEADYQARRDELKGRILGDRP